MNEKNFSGNLKNLMILSLIVVGIILMLSGSVNAYDINGNECTCNSCEDCTNALNDNSCTTVKLTADITDHYENCIDNPQNFNNKVFDCQGHTIEGDYTGAGIYLDGKSGNTIKNCVITNFVIEIYLISSQHNTITNNTLSEDSKGDWGICLSSSLYNTIINNTANNNNFAGICLDSSLNNNLINNTANNNIDGIYLDSS